MNEDKENLIQLFLQQRCHIKDRVSQAQVYSLLSTKIPFPKDLFYELVSELGVSDFLLVEDFINVYLRAFSLLYLRITNIKQQIKIYDDKKNDLLNELQEARQNQNQNQFGLDYDSVLFCQVNSAVGLTEGNYYVRITLQNQVFKTQIVSGQNNVIWNAEFQLQINSPKDIIDITLVKQFQNKEVIVGMVVVPVYQLKDQKRQEDEHILEDQSGALGDINKRLFLGLQWVHSKVNMIEDYLREIQYFQPHITAEEENLNQTLSQIEILKQPIRKLIKPYELPKKDDCNCQVQ